MHQEPSEDKWLGELLIVGIIVFTGVISHHIGKQSALDKVEYIISQEEKVTPNSIILEDLKLDISKLR